LELDPNSGSAHRELGWIEWRYEWDFPAAERDLKKALDLSPNDASAHDIYALFLKSMGRYQEALAQSNRAIELNPMEPYSRANAGSLLAMTKRYEEANLQFQRGIQVNPQEPYVWERLGPVLLMQGMKEEAIEALEKARDYSGGQQDKIAWLGYAYALSHREAHARRMLDQLMGMKANHRYVSEFHMALIYLALKDRQSCLNSLEEAFDRRDEYLVYLNVLPEFRPLDGNPRFERLKARIGFPRMTSKLW
jgi:tetratricopeptide (TPR) repeat protein